MLLQVRLYKHLCKKIIVKLQKNKIPNEVVKC